MRDGYFHEKARADSLTAELARVTAERDAAIELLRLYAPPKAHEERIAAFLDRVDAKGE